MSLREKLRALEARQEEFEERLEKEIHLRSRLVCLESKGNEYYDEVRRTIKKNFETLVSVIDNDFQYYLDLWKKEHDSVYRTRANFLLQTMAVMNTKGYKKKKADLDEIVGELDIPYFTQLHLRALVGEDFRAYQLIKNRRKTRILFYHDKTAELLLIDDEFSFVFDYLDKVRYMMESNKKT